MILSDPTDSTGNGVIVIRPPARTEGAPPMNRQQRRRALLDGHHRSALRAVAWWRSEAREGRAHTIPADLAPFVLDASHPLETR